MKQMLILTVLIFSLALAQAQTDSGATDSLVETARDRDGDIAPYVLTTTGVTKPKYVVILMPGGDGKLTPKASPDGQGVLFSKKDNFAIRIRNLIADHEFVTAETDSTVYISSVERVHAIIEDLQYRYPKAKIYLLSTSRGSKTIQALSNEMDGMIAGFINTSSLSSVNLALDTRGLKSRYLLVHHKYDGCRSTGYDGAVYNHEKFGTDLITMEGGTTAGNVCGPMAHHGYLGIESETVEKIKAWIKQDEQD